MKKHKIRFVVFGQSRSGSTLLVELLNSHPQVHCDGEIFNKNALFPNFRPLRWLFRENPSWYLQHKAKNSSTPVYGFKMFFFQVHHPEVFLKWLSTSNFKIIHVQRENILQQSLSNIVAMQTNHWHTREEEVDPSGSITIYPEKLMQVLKNRNQWKIKEQNLIKDYNHIKINYEEHLEDDTQWQDAVDKAFRFLGLETCEVETSLKPTYKKPYSQIIKNYSELMQRVKNSDFAYLLDNEN